MGLAWGVLDIAAFDGAKVRLNDFGLLLFVVSRMWECVKKCAKLVRTLAVANLGNTSSLMVGFGGWLEGHLLSNRRRYTLR